jgi:hypothetical protein
MAKEDGPPDPVSEAFRLVLQDAQSRRAAAAAISPALDSRMDRLAVVLGLLVLALICLGILALFKGWLPG